MVPLEEARRAVSEAYDAFGLDCGLERFENAFFLIDSINYAGYVSTRPLSQIGKIVYDASIGWYDFFHGLLVPNPQSMLMMRESAALEDALKERIGAQMDVLARAFRKAQHANLTQHDEKLIEAIREIVALRFGPIHELFDTIDETLELAWSGPALDDVDRRTYG